MNPTPILLAACIGLSGCALNPEKTAKLLTAYADAANKLDPDCAKDLQVNLLPMLTPWGPVPFVTGSYRKGCHLEQFQNQPVKVGATLGGPN